jgi:hypothetical protein
VRQKAPQQFSFLFKTQKSPKICTRKKKLYKTYKKKALRQRPNPRKKSILMLQLNPILQQRYVMYELCLPLNERTPLSTEYFPISDQPYVPTSQNHDFHKERLSKTSSDIIQHYLHIIISIPGNL